MRWHNQLINRYYYIIHMRILQSQRVDIFRCNISRPYWVHIKYRNIISIENSREKYKMFVSIILVMMRTSTIFTRVVHWNINKFIAKVRKKLNIQRCYWRWKKKMFCKLPIFIRTRQTASSSIYAILYIFRVSFQSLVKTLYVFFL